MKILLLSPDLPYPSESGAALRNFGIIEGLSAAGHALTLLTFGAAAALSAANPLHQLCERVQALPLPQQSRLQRISTLLTSDSADMQLRLEDPAFRQVLDETLARQPFDLIQFSGLELGGYLGQIIRGRRGAKIVYDALNAEAQLQATIAGVDRRRLDRLPAALYSRAQSRRLARFEGRICRQVDGVLTVSQEDRQHLSAYGGAPMFVLPNGIFARAYQPPPGNIRADKLLVFSGKMDYRPNVDAIEWFCRAILPQIRAAQPGTQLRVVGKNPHPRLQAVASGAAVQFSGWVEAIEPHLHEAAVYIVPLRMGSGTRLKILQAMAAGCAVVSTSLGAAGLNEQALGALILADEAAHFAQAVLALLADAARRQRLGNCAREQARRHYDWAALMPRLLTAYRELGLE